MTNPSAYRVVCRFRGQPFIAVGELDDHVAIVHLSMKPDTADDNPEIEPADNEPTTEHPPGDKGPKSGRLD
jgi:hypothetical protein